MQQMEHPHQPPRVGQALAMYQKGRRQCVHVELDPTEM